MKRRLILFSAILLAAAHLTVTAEAIDIVAFEYPPIYENGPDKGLSCEITIASFRASGIDVNLTILPVKRMIASVAEGQAVCALGGEILFTEPGIAENVHVSAIIQYVVQTFLYDTRIFPAGFAWDTLAELKGYRTIKKNGTYLTIMAKYYGSPADINPDALPADMK